MGVKATPAWPVDNFTPVKKMPMTKSSIHSSLREAGNLSATRSIVSEITDDMVSKSPVLSKLGFEKEKALR
jgi:hypothetical protein